MGRASTCTKMYNLTRELKKLADGKVILALEGGYDLPTICDSAQECVRVLLGDDLAPISGTELSRPPCQSAIETLQKTIAIQMTHWPCVKQNPENIRWKKTRYQEDLSWHAGMQDHLVQTPLTESVKALGNQLGHFMLVKHLIQSVFETMVLKLVAEDIPLLFSLLSDVFLNVGYTRAEIKELKDEIRIKSSRVHRSSLYYTTDDGMT